jgi:hypothetical protein
MVNENQMIKQREHYINLGKQALELAQEYLKTYADEWNKYRSEEWIEMLHTAEECMIKAQFLDSLLGW